jgi:cell division protein FtsW (lipid II flippase)
VFYLVFILYGIKELKSKELNLSLVLVTVFGFWALATSLWSTYPRESCIRSIVFIISSTALIMGGFCWIKFFKEKEFSFLIPANVLLLIISLFSLMTKLPYDYWTGYGFGLKSFWGHQNTLASLILFTMPGIFILPGKNKKLGIIISLILALINIYILFLTHSRTSLIIFLLCSFLFLLLSKRFKVFSFITLILIVFSIGYILNNKIHKQINDYMFKTEVSLLDRKKPIISASYDAATIGGWKGLGFGVSDTTVINNLKFNIHYHMEGVRLVREKAVSIYALIEETGWIGLIFFLLFVGYIFYLSILTYLKTMSFPSILMICLLVGMTLHAQLEGWWLGVGSVQFPLFMGLVGIAAGQFGVSSREKSSLN